MLESALQQVNYTFEPLRAQQLCDKHAAYVECDVIFRMPKIERQKRASLPGLEQCLQRAEPKVQGGFCQCRILSGLQRSHDVLIQADLSLWVAVLTQELLGIAECLPHTVPWYLR